MTELLPASVSSFVLIALAEMGDKSQLVCMTLAARHAHWPVLLGASAAFLLLNLLAVLFGATVANWLPEFWVATVVGLMFAGFGLHSLMASDDGDDDSVAEKAGHGVFLMTLLLILFAEFGDKTQIAVAGLAGQMQPLAVWLGASLALVMISALGVLAGRTLMQRLSLVWVHRVSGVLFLLFALLAGWQAFTIAGQSAA